MMGLVVATKRFATSSAPTFNIECKVTIEGEPRRFGKHTEVTIYRIIQSAMQNIAAHSHANQAHVYFEFETESFQVVVEDNGIGFDPQTALSIPDEHLGLIGMIERAESLGATLKLQSQPGEGAKVILDMPSPKYVEKVEI